MLSTKKRKSNKYVFTLRGVNTEKVDQKYNISLISNITHIESQPLNTTKLTELTDNTIYKPAQTVSFLDESKKIYQCNVSMIDFKTGRDIENNKYKCYWCRHSFNSIPIGCPINYLSNKITKNYHSEVSKDKYRISENASKFKVELFNKKKFIFTALKEKNQNVELNIQDKYGYICDGVFCSFNCCKAFIKDNKHNRLYEQSELLLIKLYNDITGLKNININAAPSWRLLEEYGGNLNINQFRENFNKITYEHHGIIKNDNIFKPIGFLYEEKINF